MLMKDGKNDCDRCQDQPTASWFAKRELKRERERESERARGTVFGSKTLSAA